MKRSSRRSRLYRKDMVSIHGGTRGGSDFAHSLHAGAFVGSDFGAQRFGRSLHLADADPTPVNSCSKALLSSKLASAAVLAIMRRTPGVSEKNSSRRARSRGQNPPRHWAQ